MVEVGSASSLQHATLPVLRSPLSVQRSAFCVQRSPLRYAPGLRAFSALRSPFSAPRSPFSAPRSPFSVQRSAFSVSVFGGARVAEGSELYASCRELGRLLGEAGYRVATGGYTGTMEAVLRGAAEAGAHTIGYTCATFEQDFQPNSWVKEERKAPNLSSRIQRIADESDAFVVVHGGLGTLAELALVWNMLLAGETRPRPLVIMGPEWPQVIDVIYAQTQMGSSALQLLTLADTPQAVVAQLRAALSP